MLDRFYCHLCRSHKVSARNASFMDPRQLFVDERLAGLCVYCGGIPDTRDHVPSKVLLDRPYPPNLPVVPCCHRCNESFSAHEKYVACLVECALTGASESGAVQRSTIKRLLEKESALCVRLTQSRREDASDNFGWAPESEAVKVVVLKLARGHAAYELALPQLDEPLEVYFAPLISLPLQERDQYEATTVSAPVPWPEVGSRAFYRALNREGATQQNGWIVVQRGRYRYSVEQKAGLVVQMVLSEYLACRVLWE